MWLRIVMKLSRLRVVSSATPTTISRLVPPSWMLIPVRLPRMIGSTATAARKIAPMRVILFRGAGQEIAGRLAGTEAGDRAVVAAQIVGDLNGVVLDGHIEVVEGQNQQQVDDHVKRGRIVEGAEECIPDRVSGLIDLQKAADGAGMDTRAEAKMMGMTPLMFSFSGRQ